MDKRYARFSVEKKNRPTGVKTHAIIIFGIQKH